MGIEDHFDQEILNLINAVEKLLKLEISMSNLNLLSTIFMLNNSELDSKIRLLKHFLKEQLTKLQTRNSNKYIRC